MTINNAINSTQDTFVGFHAALGAPYTNITGNGETIPLVFGNVITNPQGNYNSGSGLYTCDRTGLYDVGGMITFLVDSPLGFLVSNYSFVVGMQTQFGSNPVQQNAIIQPVNNPVNTYQPVTVPFKGGQFYLLQAGTTVLFTAFSNNGGTDNVSILSTVTGTDTCTHAWIRYIGNVA
jgi:hypothetical protein